MAAPNWAMVAEAPGGPEVLAWREWPMPVPQAGEVLIRHRAIGLNFIDTYFRSGSYPWPSTPLIPGAEAAGVVEAVGAGVTRWQPGDRVAYTMPVGGYCLFRTINADRLVRLPPTVSDGVAASVMLKGLTTQFLVTSCHAIQAGDIALVHAAAGGVGTLMGQWLKALGALTIGTRRQRCKGGDGEIARLHACHQLPHRGFRRSREGNHRRPRLRRRITTRWGSRYVDGIAAMLATPRDGGELRPVIRGGD